MQTRTVPHIVTFGGSSSARKAEPVSGDGGPGGPLGAERPVPSPPETPFNIAVRDCRPHDLPGLRRIKTVHRLNQPAGALAPYSVLRLGLRCGLVWPRSRRRVLVALVGERLVGFAHFQPIVPDQRWQVAALGAATGVYEPGPVWEDLVAHGVFLAGLSGIKRLYAAVPDGSAVAPAIAAVGFVPYATETVLVAYGAAPRAAARVRSQESTDTWAIHQLYNAVTPRQVQYAEALTDHRWLVGPQRGAGVASRGWLIEDGHEVVGYVRAVSREGNHVLEVLYHPGRPDVLPELIDGALAAIGPSPAGRVACAVRGYQAELATALERRGFAAYLEQTLTVKYTTVAARAPAHEALAPAPVFVGVRDKLPQRVPTFLQGRPGDDPAS